MAEILQIVCDNDQCGAVKKSENHWWELWVTDDGTICLKELHNRKPRPEAETFCGEKCATKKVSETMGAK